MCQKYTYDREEHKIIFTTSHSYPVYEAMFTLAYGAAFFSEAQ